MSSSMHLQHIFAYSYMQYIMCIYAPYIDIYYIYNAQYTFLVCDRILQQTTVFSGRSRVVTEALVWIWQPSSIANRKCSSDQNCRKSSLDYLIILDYLLWLDSYGLIGSGMTFPN